MPDDPNPNPDPTPDPQPDPAPDPTPDHKLDDDAYDKDRAMATIKKLREEVKVAKAAGRDAADLKARLDAIEAEKLTDQERLERRAADAEATTAAATAKLRRANLLVELAKPEHGIVNATAAAKLIEGVEYDDNDEPSNLASLLDDFLKANAFLKAAQGGGTGGGAAGDLNAGDGGKGGKAPALTAEQLAMAEQLGMTPERYAAFTIDNARSVDEMSAQSKALNKQ